VLVYRVPGTDFYQLQPKPVNASAAQQGTFGFRIRAYRYLYGLCLDRKRTNSV